MSELQFKENVNNSEELKVLFAFYEGAHNPGVAVYSTDQDWFTEDMSHIGYDPSDLGINDPPDYGIWVWEGRTKLTGRNTFEGVEQDMEYITDQWRQPTEKEWELIKLNKNPFTEK